MRDNTNLQHYGVVGMKWGVRRARNKQAKENYKKAEDKAFKAYEKSINSIEKGYKRGQNLSKKDYAREAAAERKYQQAHKAAKQQYKSDKSKSNDLKIANKLYSKNSKEMNARIAKMNMGEAVLKSLLMGSYGTMKYEKARSEGLGVASSAGKAVLKNAGNTYALGVPSLVEYMKNRRARKK